MKKRVTLQLAITVFCILFSAQPPAMADVTLPALFSAHMVLQREVASPIWGWADASEAITVTVGDQTVATRADAAGNWSIALQKLEASNKRCQPLLPSGTPGSRRRRSIFTMKTACPSHHFALTIGETR